MDVFLATLFLAIAFLGIGFAGIAIKIWAKKDGEFAGTCASNSPFLNEEGNVQIRTIIAYPITFLVGVD